MTERSGRHARWNWGAGIAAAIGLGVAFGAALGNWGIGLALGAGLFPVFAMTMRSGDEHPEETGDDRR